MIVTLDKYLTSNGRHPEVMKSWDGSLEKNALKTVAMISELASLANFEIKDITSGWRPTWLNKQIGGSPTSKHVYAQAIDVSDETKEFGTWLINNVALLKSRGWAIESLSITHAGDDLKKYWVHCQQILPPSGNVIFSP